MRQGVGPLGPQAVQQQAQVPPPGVGGAGGPDGREDAGIRPVEEGQVLQGEVGPQLAALLGPWCTVVVTRKSSDVSGQRHAGSGAMLRTLVAHLRSA